MHGYPANRKQKRTSICKACMPQGSCQIASYWARGNESKKLSRVLLLWRHFVFFPKCFTVVLVPVLSSQFSPEIRPGNPSGNSFIKNSSSLTDKETEFFERVSRRKPVPSRFHTRTGNPSETVSRL